MTWRAWVIGIHAGMNGVKVVGFVFTKRFRWDEIDHFAVLPLGGYPYVGHVVLTDGRRVGTFGLSSAGSPASDAQAEKYRLQVQGPVDELNQVLAMHKGASVPQGAHIP